MRLAASLSVFTVSCAVAWVVTWALVRILKGQSFLDLPNERSLHRVPTHRGGGMGVLAGAAAGLMVSRWLGLRALEPITVAGAILVSVVSAADDHSRRVPIIARAAAQLGAAGLIVYSSGGLERLPLPAPLDLRLGTLGVPLAFLWIMAVTNLYNFMDGIDGLAALQGVIAGTAIALFFSDGVLLPAGLSLAGACAGFLPYNWRPARIFLGDVGAVTVGFLFAALPFEVTLRERNRVMFLVAVCLWFFLMDGSLAVLRRLCRGEKIWTPHRSHLYQRLVGAGLPHDTVALTVSALSVSLAVLAVVAARRRQAIVDLALLAACTVSFIGYLIWTLRLELRASISRAPPRRPAQRTFE